ncbi:MAG: hypothetical protein MUF45_14220 [Spirosomaceae bacterium]|nr:hypothetical protein [Spirosomataceae bacterium]
MSKEGSVNPQQIIDRIFDENANDPQTAIKDVVTDDEIKLIESELDTPLYEDEIFDSHMTDSVFSDKIVSSVNSYFGHIKSRKSSFGTSYPFTITKENTLIFNSQLSEEQKVYTILLCSSLMRLATKSGVNRLGHHFEELCGPVFNALLPKNAKSYFFGSGSKSLRYDSIEGNFFDKIDQLCSLLHVRPNSNFTKNNAGIHNVGDGGIDWVGIYDFGDDCSSQPTFLGQCACGIDWIDKQFDANISKWKNYIEFSNSYQTYHFTPRNFRNEMLKWENPLQIYDVVLIDRYRLIKILANETGLSSLINDVYGKFLEEIQNDDNKIDYFA